MIIGLVGCGGFGREVMPIIEEMEAPRARNATIIFVDTLGSNSGFVNGIPVLTESEFLSHNDPEKFFNVAIADSRVRETISARFSHYGVKPLSLISKYSTIYKNNNVNEGCIICAGSIITSNVSIGSFFHCNLLSYVAHDCVIGNFVTFAPRVSCNGKIRIHDHAYIGTGAVIKQGSDSKPLTIGAGAVVGMGAVVTKSVPPGETWVGNPAHPMLSTK